MRAARLGGAAGRLVRGKATRDGDVPDIRFDSITIDPRAEIKILRPDVATLLYRVTYASASKNAKAVTMRAMSASTYVRRGSKWWSVLYQETPTP